MDGEHRPARTWPFTDAKMAILLATLAIMRERGPRAAILRGIASRVGVSEPAIFRHFNGVDGLFEALFVLFDDVSTRVERGFVNGKKGAERFRSGLLSAVDELGAGRELAYLYVQAEAIFGAYRELRDRIAEAREFVRRSALGALDEAATTGQMKLSISADTLVTTLLGLLGSSSLAWCVGSGEASLRAELEPRIDELLRIFLAIGG